jgi:HAE1 family hydrophobic/amphiphilic exporter-1
MLSKIFIQRPILAGVIAIVMTLVGGLAIIVLPIEQYPEIAPPTIQVSAIYPGADARTVTDTVAAPIEQEVNGVEGMIYMSSISANDGSYVLTVTFELGTDVDMASVQVQNRVAIAEPRLPQEVRQQGVTTRKRSQSMLMVLSPHSPDGRYDQLFLSNYATIYMKDALARVPGVGQVTVFGAKDFSMRVWLDPEKLAARDLTTVDVLDALREQNVQVAAGRIGAEPAADPYGFQLSMQTKGRLASVEEFENIVLRVGADQRALFLKDVARVELGAQSYDSFGRFNGMAAPVISISQLPGSNALEVADGVRAELERLRQEFPDGLACPVFYDFSDFVTASIKEVVVTLLVAAGLVFLTVLVFLQNGRATVIPGVAIPVSIIGSFAVLLAFGFSINMLTLFALVLAIGIVVDDAIVVVENTARLMQENPELTSKEAAQRSMREITGPVIATTLVLLAVFVPTAVLGGITGQLYRQFGITLSIATVLSSINALTLSPALCGVLLRQGRPRLNIFYRGFNRVLDFARAGYVGSVRVGLRLAVIAVLLFAGILGGAVYALRTIPTGFLPMEDQSYVFVNVQLPDAAKLDRTRAVLAEASEFVRGIDGVAGTVTIGGTSLLTNSAQPNAGSLVVILDPWEERKTPERSVETIIGKMMGKFAQMPEAFVFPFRPPPIQGLGSAGGFDMQIQDRGNVGFEFLERVTGDVLAAAQQSGKIQSPFTSFRATVPQVFVDVDREKAKRLGVPLSVVFNTLQTYLGSSYVNDFNLFGRVYQVRAQAEARFRQSRDNVRNLEVRDEQGNSLPMSTIARLDDIFGPDVIFRYNLFPAAQVLGSAVPGNSSGQAVALMESLAAQKLPPGFAYEWTGITYQEKQAGNLAPIVFGLALVFVFLFLAAQYESWSTPLTIMATIPIGVLGALLMVWLRGMDNNVYTQIGLVLLIALVCKNAILIVEFAEQLRKEGQSPTEAALAAAKLRFRPILMTALSFVLGTFPLLVATGAGASSRQAIGTAVFGGMVVATFVGVFFIPLMYVVVVRIAGVFRRAER